MKDVRDSLAQETIAVAGVSRDANAFSTNGYRGAESEEAQGLPHLQRATNFDGVIVPRRRADYLEAVARVISSRAGGPELPQQNPLLVPILPLRP